jgi:hypothetical protein
VVTKEIDSRLAGGLPVVVVPEEDAHEGSSNARGPVGISVMTEKNVLGSLAMDDPLLR